MTKEDRTLNRVLNKFVPILDDLERLKKVLPQESLEDIQIMLESFADWEGWPTAKRMFQVERDRRQDEVEAVAASTPMGGTLSKGAVQAGGLDKGAVQSAPARSAITRPGPSETPAGGTANLVLPSLQMRAEAGSPPTGGTANLELPSVQMRAEGVVGGRAAAAEAVVRGSGLVADPDLRISLSDARVKEQVTVSKEKLETLLEKLDTLHGEDAEVRPGANTSEVPLTQEELGEIKWAVKAAIDLHNAPSLSSQLIDALNSIYKFLQECLVKLTLLGLGAGSAFKALEWAVEELKELLVVLGVPL
jgi:hypothetical protein